MLNGWKAIGSYLKRDERTAMRWAAERGLPVHRAPGPGRGVVYALTTEIDGWLVADRERTAEARPSPAPSPPASIDATVERVSRSRSSWLIPALIVGGLLLAALGALTLRGSAARFEAPTPAFTDPAAKALYLQATYDWNLRTADSLQRAIREYSEAIGRDPRVAPSYVGLANSYLLLREYGSMPDADAYQRAEAAARAAVDLAPRSAEAHRALAFSAFWWRQDRAAARREFARAIALGPDDALTHHWYATALAANGQPDAALREIGRARDLDPASTAIAADQGLLTYLAGDAAQGVDLLRSIERDQPNAIAPHRYLALIALWEGRPDEYLDERAATARLRGDAADAAPLDHLRAAATTPSALVAAMLHDAQASAALGSGWFPVAQLASLADKPALAADALTHACVAHEPATIGAKGDLWLSRALTPARIAALCGGDAQL